MREITISEKSLKEWQMELEEIDSQVQKLNKRRLVLVQRIESFPLFFDNGTGNQIRNQPSLSFIDNRKTIAEIIKVVLKDYRNLTKLELRKRLLKHLPEEKLGSGFNYFYVAIQRMKKNNIIEEKNGILKLKE